MNGYSKLLFFCTHNLNGCIGKGMKAKIELYGKITHGKARSGMAGKALTYYLQLARFTDLADSQVSFCRGVFAIFLILFFVEKNVKMDGLYKRCGPRT